MGLDPSHNGPVLLALLATSTTAAKVLDSGRANDFPPGIGRKGVWITNEDATISVRLGDASANLTTTNGLRLPPGQRVWLDWTLGDYWYVIAESGTPNIGRLVVT